MASHSKCDTLSGICFIRNDLSYASIRFEWRPATTVAPKQSASAANSHAGEYRHHRAIGPVI
ncbi:hypothetical protein HQ560_18180 [bacterium]|nr:hypothetical protein [bacterium]